MYPVIDGSISQTQYYHYPSGKGSLVARKVRNTYSHSRLLTPRPFNTAIDTVRP